MEGPQGPVAHAPLGRLREVGSPKTKSRQHFFLPGAGSGQEAGEFEWAPPTKTPHSARNDVKLL
jgi:hypothetical protein